MNAIFFCDASVRGGRAGVGICVVSPNGEMIDSFARRVPFCGMNSNRAEVAGILECLSYATEKAFSKIRIYCDCQSVVRAIQRGKASKMPLKILLKAVGSFAKKIVFEVLWTRGHNGRKWNEFCDNLARRACKNKSIPHTVKAPYFFFASLLDRFA